MCLVVRVGPPGARGTVREEREKEKERVVVGLEEEEKWPIGEKVALTG